MELDRRASNMIYHKERFIEFYRYDMIYDDFIY